ncbi:MAG: hypothetical protein LUG51_02950 [Tannerellaceae bacterium]|nr:hypothetical protein [Tannerellaceae bacterium]
MINKIKCSLWLSLLAITMQANPVKLYGIPLSEVKKQVNGRWELVSAQNFEEELEYEGTYITFAGDNYIWTDAGESEEGALNWRKEDSGEGYEAWLMDVFYEENPSYPLEIEGDTLYIQDFTESGYKYLLIRRK